MTPAPQLPDPWDLVDRAETILLVHAHPDDESLATGALIADLAASGKAVHVLTTTRGEEGEVVDGAIDPADTRSLEDVRAEEIARACGALGVRRRMMLGQEPALAAGHPPRRYRDSGMRWVRPGLAGPAESAGPESFTMRDIEDAVADLSAAITVLGPDVVLGYDDAGTYGHPDHVHAHEVTALACRAAGVPFVEFLSLDEDGTAPAGTSDARWRDHPDSLAAVRTALEAYRTQLTVIGEDRDGPGAIRVRHVGGQRQRIPLRTGLRTATD